MKNLIYSPQWIKILIGLKNNQDKDNINLQLKNDFNYVSNVYKIIEEMEKLGLLILVSTSGRGNKAIIKDVEVITFIERYEKLVYDKLQKDSLSGDN